MATPAARFRAQRSKFFPLSWGARTESGSSIKPTGRLRLALGLVALPVAIQFALRLVLCERFLEASSPAIAAAGICAEGLVNDIAAMTLGLGPFLFGLAVFRWRFLELGWLRTLLFGLLAAGVVFLSFTEYYFFEEFNSRFNRVAVDYLLYPHEVIGNIRESYGLKSVAAISLVLGAALGYAWSRGTRSEPAEPQVWHRRAIQGAGTVAGLFVLGLGVLRSPLSLSNERVGRELAANGYASILRAYWSADLDYSSYYATLPAAEAIRRASELFSGPVQTTPDGAPALTKSFETMTTPDGEAYDVVVILEESLGSEFSSRFGGATKSFTPQLDRWSQQGLALTQLTANGNRTVRGLEGVLSSFLPLPGGAILHRNRSENVATLARVFRSLSYRTTFMYGGRGVFDGLRAFAIQNGYQEFVEQKDFPSEAFHTIWGVADEYLFDALLERQRTSRSRGDHLFATALTVSNHKPYSVPEGRVDWPAAKRSRRGAVLYADWALGRYLDQAKSEGLLDHTVVLVVGDHGARVYGSAAIPTGSYRIPAIYLTPHARWQGKALERLCSQVDLAPTLLELAGISCQAPFLGRSLLGLPTDGGRAFVLHNYDVGMLTDEALVVLGLNKLVTCYKRSGRNSDVFSSVDANARSDSMHELERDTQAAFQVASELYLARNYRLPQDLSASARTAQFMSAPANSVIAPDLPGAGNEKQ